MKKIETNSITNANVYIDGNSLLGRAEEIKIPDIKAIMSERKSLGMVGKVALPTGFDKMEGGEIKWNSLYADVAVKCANPFKSYQLQVRSNVQTFGSQGLITEIPLVTFLTVMFTEFSPGTFKQHDPAEFPTKFQVTYIQQVMNGRELYELDVLANIYTVDGEDQLAAYRANLGA